MTAAGGAAVVVPPQACRRRSNVRFRITWTASKKPLQSVSFERSERNGSFTNPWARTLIREAYWREEALLVQYTDRNGEYTERIIWPLAIVYFDNTLHITSRAAPPQASPRSASKNRWP
ncbi:WYL domain-containing protein [Hydrogenophaga sp. PBL-H3]|jgi:predicted DNA-binding transcriptional regulator YafY|uniref:WYL domain-containing protein n=1 Tax=Hydrogenophaga sp. PBL-H3 TaxID=434010 RepID=UPI003FA60077